MSRIFLGIVNKRQGVFCHFAGVNEYLLLSSQYVAGKYGDGFAVVPGSIRDFEDLYCFTFQTKKFLETNNIVDMAVGNGYTFIYKLDNRIFEAGSRFTFEQSLKDLRNKLKVESYIKRQVSNFRLNLDFDLKILEIHQVKLLLDVLDKHELTYIIPEVVGDSIFRISKRYTQTLLQTRLKDLPVIFHGVDHLNCLYLADELLRYNICRFELQERQVKNYARYVGRATAEDLESIW